MKVSSSAWSSLTDGSAFLIQEQVDAITSCHLPFKASILHVSRPRTEHAIHGILFRWQFLSLVTKNLALSYFVSSIWTPVPQKCYSQTVVFRLTVLASSGTTEGKWPCWTRGSIRLVAAKFPNPTLTQVVEWHFQFSSWLQCIFRNSTSGIVP